MGDLVSEIQDKLSSEQIVETDSLSSYSNMVFISMIFQNTLLVTQWKKAILHCS